MLKINDIHKSFSDKHVLRGIEVELTKGIYGLLGVNGAGKTTLINIITGIMLPDNGEIMYENEPIERIKREYRSIIGYMPQYASFYSNFTAWDFMKYMCEIKGIKRKQQNNLISDILQKVNLYEEKNHKIATFSGGMRQRIGIAQSIINNPKILILDEPTAGLDPIERIRFRKLITDLSDDRIVLLATHIVQDIEFISNKVMILHNGKITENGKTKKLLEQLKGKVGIIKCNNKDKDFYLDKYIVSNVVVEEETSILRIVNNDVKSICDVCVEPNLEDVFLYYENNIELEKK